MEARACRRIIADPACLSPTPPTSSGRARGRPGPAGGAGRGARPERSRGVRHALAVVLALTACAGLAGATSVPAVGEWVADAPSSVLQRLGVWPDPLCPKPYLPAETTVRRLLGRIDGEAPVQAVGRWAGRQARRHRRSDARSGGGRQEPARSGRGLGPEDPPARRLRPRPRPGPGPAGRGREDQRDHLLPAAASHPR
ncbi:transposase family protein [Streptomyces sp. CG1]|uniref:transposase family protein n=1 Tax=Streptomyces sp. CG1 TaxID=1287523 RepID=UPI0034E1C10D